MEILPEISGRLTVGKLVEFLNNLPADLPIVIESIPHGYSEECSVRIVKDITTGETRIKMPMCIVIN